MGAVTRLTELQMKFAHEIVSNEGRKNGTECAISAGYAEDSAGVRAAELQSPKRFPLVVKYIGELREEYQKKYAVTFERHKSLGPRSVKLYPGSAVRELDACGLRLEPLRLGLEACGLMLSKLGA